MLEPKAKGAATATPTGDTISMASEMPSIDVVGNSSRILFDRCEVVTRRADREFV